MGNQGNWHPQYSCGNCWTQQGIDRDRRRMEIRKEIDSIKEHIYGMENDGSPWWNQEQALGEERIEKLMQELEAC